MTAQLTFSCFYYSYLLHVLDNISFFQTAFRLNNPSRVVVAKQSEYPSALFQKYRQYVSRCISFVDNLDDWFTSAIYEQV